MSADRFKLYRVSHRLGRESSEAQWAAKRHNPARTVNFRFEGKNRHFTVGAGSDDTVELYRIPGDERTPSTFYVISWNWGYGYVGIQVFDPDGVEDEGLSFFCQNSQDVEDVLGPRGLDNDRATIARRLIRRVHDLGG